MCKPAVFFCDPKIKFPFFKRVIQRRGCPAGGKICAACSQKKEVLIEREGKGFRSLWNFERIFEKIRLLAVAIRIASMEMSRIPGKNGLLNLQIGRASCRERV